MSTSANTKTWLDWLNDNDDEADRILPCSFRRGYYDSDGEKQRQLTNFNVVTARRSGLQVLWDGQIRIPTIYQTTQRQDGGSNSFPVGPVADYRLDASACLKLFEGYLWTAQQVGGQCIFTVHLAEREYTANAKTLTVAMLKVRWAMWLTDGQTAHE